MVSLCTSVKTTFLRWLSQLYKNRLNRYLYIPNAITICTQCSTNNHHCLHWHDPVGRASQTTFGWQIIHIGSPKTFCYRDLWVHGLATATDTQQYVNTVWLSGLVDCAGTYSSEYQLDGLVITSAVVIPAGWQLRAVEWDESWCSSAQHVL